LAPEPEDVHIEDIAHALSMLCRYSGMCRNYFSVAEHSVLMSYMVPQDYALEALLHDGAEAYVGDVIMPLKPLLPDFKKLERQNELAVRIRFRLPHEVSLPVRKADRDIVITEYETLMPAIPASVGWEWDGEKDPSVELKLWCPTIAEMKFLERYRVLTEGP
jgi:hypothetical protein